MGIHSAMDGSQSAPKRDERQMVQLINSEALRLYEYEDWRHTMPITCKMAFASSHGDRLSSGQQHEGVLA